MSLFRCVFSSLLLALLMFSFETAFSAQSEQKDEIHQFMEEYQKEVSKLIKDVNLATWDAYTEGGDLAFVNAAAKMLELAKYHSNAAKYETLKELRKTGKDLDPVFARSVDKALLAFQQCQLPHDLLEKITSQSAALEQTFQTFRGILDGKEYSNNELLEMLEKEMDSTKRQAIWEALKQVGEKVAPQLIELAKTRNEAARSLGFKNFWEMSVHFQEYTPERLMKLFAEVDETTRPLFLEMKKEMDAELREKFSVEKVMPWNYDNPFFQQAPPSKEVNPNDFYKDRTKEDIIAFSRKYFEDIGLPVEPILKRSDLFERDKKSQHAFCFDIDNSGDVRILCNIKPTVEWMDTQLHELGHGVYSLNNDMSLPYNLRDSAHIFTTEGIAMFFGAKARTPKWMIEYAGVEPEKANAVADALKRQRRKEQLIFARWTLVMLNFEKALYENPDADLNSLWWETVEKYQGVPRPENRNKADWASKPHFVSAPVYYHNYQLGELFAAQLRNSLGVLASENSPKLGEELKKKVFHPCASQPWEEFVEKATGSPLSARFFAEELK
ncbi:MAG: M2 family metallopeptidase [Thermoguttaceae bacterium]